MCMISLPIEQVSKTNIFVGLNSAKTHQITIYSNFVSNNSNGNAMVIPVPFPSTVKFHDVSCIKNFFKVVDQSFYRIAQTLGMRSDSYSFNMTNSAKTKSVLEVFSVGSYNVSLANNLSDISRLDKDVFILSPGLAKTLEEHYSDPVWGFIVFVLARDKKDYHPFAFSHALYYNKIYIPTRHYHDSMGGSVGYMERIGGLDTRSNPYEDQFNKINSNSNVWNTTDMFGYGSMADDWSHNIYLFNCGQSGSKSQLLRSMLNQEYRYGWDKNLYWNRRLINFDLEACDGFEKYHIEGTHPNLDIMLPVC
jgi:hypothetical protein